MTKLTNYPEALDTENNLPDIAPSNRMNEPGMEHHAQHTRLNQAVIELQKKVGKNASEDEASHEFRIVKLEEVGGGGAGLEVLAEDKPVFERLNVDLVVPDNPSLWFLVEVAGERFAVPGYKIAKLPEPPTAFLGSANATFIMPTKVGVV